MCSFGPFGEDPLVWTHQFWLEPVDSTFTLACILEPKINLSWLVHCRTAIGDILSSSEHHWDMLHCTHAESRAGCIYTGTTTTRSCTELNNYWFTDLRHWSANYWSDLLICDRVSIVLEESHGLCMYSALCLSNSYTSLSYLVPAMSDEAVINDNQTYLNIVTIISTVR